MNPSKVDRNQLKSLTDLPNIGKALADDLHLLGIHEPQQLIGLCPYEMYEKLCKVTKSHHDPCVLDTFISVTRFINGEEPRPWWAYTAERKQTLNRNKSSIL